MVSLQNRKKEKKEVKTDVQAKQNVCFFYMSVQIFISRHGDNYFVLEDAPILLSFYFPEAPSSAIHLFKKKKPTHKPTKTKPQNKQEEENKGKHSQGSLCQVYKSIFKRCKGVVECLLDDVCRCYIIEDPRGFSVNC